MFFDIITTIFAIAIIAFVAYVVLALILGVNRDTAVAAGVVCGYINAVITAP